jgi:hypothetical protein
MRTFYGAPNADMYGLFAIAAKAVVPAVFKL